MTASVRVGGAWKSAGVQVKVNGAWKPAGGYTKVAGAWKQFGGVDPKDCHIITIVAKTGNQMYLPCANPPLWVDWGDGTIESTNPTASHEYATIGTYVIRAIFDWDNSLSAARTDCITDIQQFGLNSLTGKRNQIAHGKRAFMSSQIANCAAVANLDTSNLNEIVGIFSQARQFNTDLSKWDTSNVTDMNNAFSMASSFNADIAEWNVSNVNNMGAMFYNASQFDQDLSGWCVAKITNPPNMFSQGCPLTPAHMPKWGTCPGSDPISLTKTAAGTWTVANYVADATYTPGRLMTWDPATQVITVGNTDTYITVKYTNGVELRTYVSRMQYTTHPENHPYQCGTHECNCRDDWASCGCECAGGGCGCYGEAGQSFGQCGCPGVMCWYNKQRKCDQCPTMCDNWVDVKDATPAGFEDTFGEWTRVAQTPRSEEPIVGIKDWTIEGVHVLEDGTVIGWFPVDYNEETNQPVPGGAASASVVFHKGDEILGYYESTMDSDVFTLVKFVDQNKWGYLLKTERPEWLEVLDEYEFDIINADLVLMTDEEGVVDGD